MKAPTLKDIAEAAGVSITTASLVLSGKGRISESVRAAVLDASDRLGYGKKRAAEAGRGQPSAGILISIDARWAFVWNFIRPIVAQIEASFAERGHNVVLIPIHAGLDADAIARRVLEERCVAVFALHYGNADLFAGLEERGVPVILIMNGSFQDRFHSILADDFQGAYEGTSHLVKLGHRDLLFLGTERVDLPNLKTDRYYGFSKAMEEAGLRVDDQRNLSCDATNTQYLEAQLHAVFSAKDAPTAIFAIDDDMALRASALVRAMGLRIPEDLSIIAPGDLLNYGDPFIPPITTLRIDTTLMGKLASDMMFRRLSGEGDGVHVLKIKQQLVQRGSTRPLATTGRRVRASSQGSQKERFLASFERRSQPAVSRWLGASREFIALACAELGVDEEGLRVRIGDDLRWVDDAPIGQSVRRVDPFGIERRGSGYGQPSSHPLREAPTIESLRDYPWPESEQEDVSGIRERIAEASERYAIVGGSWSPFWHDAVDLLGMETLACLMYDDPLFVETMLSRIVDYYAAVNTRIFEEAGDLIDLIFVRNDFGTQTGPLISVEHFERFVAPCLRRLVEVAHRYGIKVMLHSSGGIRPLIPAIAATGVDALHALQPDCPGMQGAALRKDFGGKLVLSGGIDARGVLLRGTPAEVRSGVLATLDAMAPGGGYIAAPSVDAVTEDVPVANVLAMFDAVAEWREL